MQFFCTRVHYIFQLFSTCCLVHINGDIFIQKWLFSREYSIFSKHPGMMWICDFILFFNGQTLVTSEQKLDWSFVFFFLHLIFSFEEMFSREEATSVFCDSFITLIINHLPRTFAPCCRRRIWGKLKIMQSAELCQVIILISPHDWKEMTGLKFRFWT